MFILMLFFLLERRFTDNLNDGNKVQDFTNNIAYRIYSTCKVSMFSKTDWGMIFKLGFQIGPYKNSSHPLLGVGYYIGF